MVIFLSHAQTYVLSWSTTDVLIVSSHAALVLAGECLKARDLLVT